MLNIFRTLAHAPEALTAFLAWGSYVLSKKNALPPRERELVILRIGFLCGSSYEWTQHVEIGLRAGLTRDEIEKLKGKLDESWPAADSALLAACSELHHEHFISDKTWAALKAHFSDRQCMDLVFTAASTRKSR